MHIYAFGSLCRGDVDVNSDVDLLALVDGYDPRFDPSKYSIYSYEKMQKLWLRGSPFAWHLSLEGRLLFSSDGSNALELFGAPALYRDYVLDCKKFFSVFLEAQSSLRESESTRVFDLSSIFLGIRNICTCFSLGVLHKQNVSRNVALEIGELSVPLAAEAYRILERSRILCTRSIGSNIETTEAEFVLGQLSEVENWMKDIVRRAKLYERIQQSGRSAETTDQDS
jgi:hypothetical protein